MLQQVQQNKNGQFQQTDFPDNTGGTNLVDSVFKIAQNQAAGGYNFDYVLTGGIRKRLGSALINSAADSQLYSLGFGLYAPTSGTSKSVFRAAGQELQLFDTSAPSFTALTQDNAAASSTPFTSGTTQDVQFMQFSNGTNDILWGAGGGAAFPVGAYSTAKYTSNGCATPTVTMTASNNVSGAGSWSTGNYGVFYYTLVLHKSSTGALSNGGYLAVLNTQAVDPFATTTNTLSDSVSLNWSLTGVDTTTYDKIYVYRSAVAGVSGFTTGNLIAQLSSTATSFTDLGNLGNPDVLLVQTVPRAANLILDNSPLPTGTYNTMAVWGHRLCTSSGNNLYISDVNKSESWPLSNYITVPSAGPITALGVISQSSPQASAIQEFLVIFKERELWVLTAGSANNYTTWTLMKVDSVVGCPQQSLLVSAQGFLAWIDYRGVWIWDGTSKPIYCSRLLEPLFGTNGDLDKTKFAEGCGAFFRRENQITWYLSSKTYGTQQFAIKMDVRLTMLQIEQNLTGRTIDGVFIQDVHSNPIYAAMSYVPLSGQDEQSILGDNAGYCYFASKGYSDGGSAYNFRYLTPPLSMGDPNTNKQFLKVIAWVQDVGTWNLYLDYWSNYETSVDVQSTIGLPVSSENQTAALWDIATFGMSYFDAYFPKVIPIVFNLQAGTYNSAEGSALQLQFRNDNANQPITIHGFSVIYTVLGGITQ